MQNRGTRKRIIRQATQLKIAAEKALIEAVESDGIQRIGGRRLEEADNLRFFKNVPSVQEFAIKLGLEI